MAWGTIDAVTRINSSDSLEFNSWNVFVVEKIDNDWKWVLFNQSTPKSIQTITNR